MSVPKAQGGIHNPRSGTFSARDCGSWTPQTPELYRFFRPDSGPAVEPLIDALLTAAGMPAAGGVDRVSADTTMPGGVKCISACRMAWDVGGRAAEGPGNIAVVVAELDKVAARYNGENLDEVLRDEALAWLYLLSRGYEDPEEMSRMVERFPTMDEFAQRYGVAIDDPELKGAYERYWEAELNHRSAIRQARDDGFSDGRNALASRLRELGVDEALLAKALAEPTGAAPL